MHIRTYMILRMGSIYPTDRKGSMQSSYSDPEHNNVLDKSSLESSECSRWLKN